MQTDQSKSCGNCIFLENTNTQIRHAKKHNESLERTIWGFCRKVSENMYKKEICDKHEYNN